MENKQEWLERFYQDLMNQQTRYIRDIPPLCSSSYYRQSIQENQTNLIEKKIFPSANLYRKKHFDQYGYYIDRRPAEKFNMLHNKNIDLTAFIDSHVHDRLIVDNSFFDQHHESYYRAVILDGVQDYVLNYAPKLLKHPNSYVATIPSSCIVLVNMDGSYFYVRPLDNSVWLDDNAVDILPTHISDDVKLLAYNLFKTKSVPYAVIKTTITNIIHVLDATQPTKVLAIGSPRALNNSMSPLLHDDQGNIYPVYKYSKAIRLILYTERSGHEDFFMVLGQKFEYQKMIKLPNNKEMLSAWSVNRMKQDHRQSIAHYLANHLINQYHSNGNIYYTFEKGFSNSYWNEFFKKIPTQNVNHDFLRAYDLKTDDLNTYDYDIMYQSWNIFAKKNWDKFTNEQVEDVPQKKLVKIQPIVQPTGLNALVMIMYPGLYHYSFISQHKLIQLYCRNIYLGCIDVRSMKLS